ncbi:MAG TPA: NAD(P)/FAD-dependent oxidoreductase [Streptosporangiaceae bacterium]|nr:NAD(P)/FAD-dependent oxidoreductase [Streptosporangiaceae bacterium]
MGGGLRILIVGGGYGGMHTALRLERLLRPGEATVTVADPRPYMTYQPLLAEAAAGNLEPRHVVVPLRGVLHRTQVIKAAVRSIDHARRVACLTDGDGSDRAVGYDLLVLAPGSASRVLPVPGLAETGIGFKTIGEAIHLRNHVLGRLDAAASASSAQARQAALAFVFVGGGYAGVEALAELQDMAFDACARYPELSHREMRWILVEAADRILPEVSPAMADYTAALLRRRHIEVRLRTRLTSAEDGRIRLDDGEEFPAGTLVWTAGVTPSPLARNAGLATDDRGRVIVDEFLAVKGTEDAWALGDCAAVPDLAAGDGALCAPTAQHAWRQGRRLAGNIAAVLHGGTPRPYRHATAGSVASLGLYRGVAEVYGLRLRGFPAWMTHRTYHLLKLPTVNRRLRVVADWTLALLFPREAVSLDVIEHPRQDFQDALRVIAAAPSHLKPPPDREEKEREEKEAGHHAYHR